MGVNKNRISNSHTTIIGTNSILTTSPIYGIANNTSVDLDIAFGEGSGTVTIGTGTIWMFESEMSPMISKIEVTSTVSESITYFI